MNKFLAPVAVTRDGNVTEWGLSSLGWGLFVCERANGEVWGREGCHSVLVRSSLCVGGWRRMCVCIVREGGE